MKCVVPSILHDETARLVVLEAELMPHEPLTASYSKEDQLIMTEWEPSREDIIRFVNGGRIRVWMTPTGCGVTPLMLEAVELVENDDLLSLVEAAEFF